MSPRTMADRLDRARQRAQRREALHVLLARVDRLSPAEAALLVDYVRAELDASDHLRATIQGQQTAMQEASDRTRAAEAAIVEAEKDRDRAEAERDALAGGVPLVCSDERHKTKVFALETALATEKDISRRLLSQRQEMAAERFAWQERGDKAEAAVERVRAYLEPSLKHVAVDPAEVWNVLVAGAALDKHQEQQPGARPTHPDGTPYRYAEIVAEGWEHCDGCGQWGNTWTPEEPHQCPAPIKVATAPAP